MGAIGVLTSGVVLYNAVDAAGRDAVAHEIQDSCGGHPDSGKVYHYHSVPPCVGDSGSGHSSLVGYALDGFGIYGYRGQSGETLTNADLDECHGHTHEVEWDGQVVIMYHYHATYEYPYTIGCYRGTASRGLSAGEGSGQQNQRPTQGADSGQSGDQATGEPPAERRRSSAPGPPDAVRRSVSTRERDLSRGSGVSAVSPTTAPTRPAPATPPRSVPGRRTGSR